MKKIIVPIDFSKHSEYALKTAALLASKHNATVYALHMLDIQEISLSESETYQQEKAMFFLKLAEKKFKDLAVSEGKFSRATRKAKEEFKAQNKIAIILTGFHN